MAEERNRYQRKKIFLTVMHVLFLVVTAAGISAMYLNSDYGKGISWVYDEVYEDSPQFSTRLEQDIEKIFSYVGYRDVFETDGKLDMERTIVGISDGPGLSEELTLDQLVRYAKTRGYYLDENFTVQGVPTSMDDDDDEITVDWQSYNPNFMDRELEENGRTWPWTCWITWATISPFTTIILRTRPTCISASPTTAMTERTRFTPTRRSCRWRR